MPNHEPKIHTKDWYSGSIEELGARITPEDLALIDDYQTANAQLPHNLMHNPVPLDFADRERDAAHDVLNNVIQTTKPQREIVMGDPVIRSLKAALHQGMNEDMTREAMRARKTVIMLRLSQMAMTEQIAPPEIDDDSQVSVRRATPVRP